ncbi:PH domain-containing protein [Nocardiopsis kunsanensis]|uniref:PH domain-containing protein n=1 Tax=Nocardiopsis kunsanensis TaxID=141693 RepID=UPI00034C894A|nr:PH domain-containing protein [Nocardiopsis kunsanensis]
MDHEYESPETDGRTGPDSPEPAGPEYERSRWARGPAGRTADRYPYEWQNASEEPRQPGAGAHPASGARRPGPQSPDTGARSVPGVQEAAASERVRWGPPQDGRYGTPPDHRASGHPPGQDSPGAGSQDPPGNGDFPPPQVPQGHAQDRPYGPPRGPWQGYAGAGPSGPPGYPYHGSADGPRSPEGHGPAPQPRQWWSEEAAQPFTSESGRRLSPRSMVVGPLNQLRSILFPILVGLVIGGFNPWLLAATGATVVMVLVGGFVTWRTLRYEITDDHIEIRKGLVRRERRTIPLQRIRGVDVTSSLLHRILGVSVVHIEAAAGSTEAEDGKLDAVGTAEAERLRGELLRRKADLAGDGSAGSAGSEQEREEAADPETVTYFGMPRSWYLYGALSLAHLLTPFALMATLIGLFQQSAPQMEAATDTVVDWLDSTDRALLTALAVGIPVALVLMMPVFAVVSYAVTNWGFALRGSDGSLVAERGLFTRRSVTLEKRRIRGHELRDNPLERTRDAVSLRAIVTGLGEAATRAVLLPTGPRQRVAEVVERALDRYEGGLRPHPRAALHRRLIRSVGPFLATGAAGVLLGWNWLVAVSAVLALLGVPLGIDRYRSLGHGHDESFVSVRSGSLQREQAVVERSAVIGWSWTQTLFQRRAGLANLQVTVGAGAGEYTAQDASMPDSVAFAAGVTPQMVRPFLVERDGGAAASAEGRDRGPGGTGQEGPPPTEADRGSGRDRAPTADEDR